TPVAPAGASRDSHVPDRPILRLHRPRRRGHRRGTISARGRRSAPRIRSAASTFGAGPLPPLADARRKVAIPLATPTFTDFGTWRRSEGVGADPFPRRHASVSRNVANSLCEEPPAA